MSKAKSFSKVIKIIATLLAHGAKLTFVLIFGLLRKIFKDISKRLRFSITFKTASVYILVFSTILMILSIILVSSFGLFLIYQAKDSLEKSTRVTAGLLSESAGLPEAKIKKYADAVGITITLFDKQKRIIYTTEANKNNVTFNGQTFLSTGIFIGSDQKIYLNTMTEVYNGINYIQLSGSLTKEKVYLAILLPAIAIGSILAVIITISIGSRTSKKMLKPIDDMIDTARSISARVLHTRLNVVDSHDELKDLAETFNEMLDRIEAAYEQQNQFVSDASHELRTPISVIQGYANLLQRWGKGDKEVLEESVGAIKNEAENMKGLVENLLFLARADKDTQKLEKSPFAMNELVDEVVKETRMIDTDHKITSDTNELMTLNADRNLIKQALRIFVDNSIKYTARGGTIKIASFLKGRTAVLSIEDNGIGISREELPLIFNRFYKCDKSRTREGGSTGLGLSISKWIIEKHKGTINVDSALNQGTKIIISLPV